MQQNDDIFIKGTKKARAPMSLRRYIFFSGPRKRQGKNHHKCHCPNILEQCFRYEERKWEIPMSFKSHTRTFWRRWCDICRGMHLSVGSEVNLKNKGLEVRIPVRKEPTFWLVDLNVWNFEGNGFIWLSCYKQVLIPLVARFNFLFKRRHDSMARALSLFYIRIIYFE